MSEDIDQPKKYRPTKPPPLPTAVFVGELAIPTNQATVSEVIRAAEEAWDRMLYSIEDYISRAEEDMDTETLVTSVVYWFSMNWWSNALRNRPLDQRLEEILGGG
jgi:hypothetical protein